MAGSRIYTVTQLNQEIKNLLESNPSFFNLFVSGEISNYKPHPSGHHYMTIKDEGAAISAVMFRSDASKLRFRLHNGMKIVARGRISSFPKSGQVQIYVSDMMPDGVGALHMQFEQLKEKLLAEGLFDAQHKADIPAFPEHIALITSPSAAALRDMLRILSRRWPLASIEIFPSLVQGRAAPADLVRALHLANQRKKADVIIIGRGGGSLEDLWAFNDEQVARAIYASKIPVVSAVGHEPDVTISDFVADLRAPTPSGAAELIAPDCADIKQTLVTMDTLLRRSMQKKHDQLALRFRSINQRLAVQTPLNYVRERAKTVNGLSVRLNCAAKKKIHDQNVIADYTAHHMAQALQHTLIRYRGKLMQSSAALDALSPLKVLSCGYAVASTAQGEILSDAAKLMIGEQIHIRFSKGKAICEVQEVKSEE